MTKRFRWAALGCAALLMIPASASAQFSEGFNFLKAVKDADGQKVTDIIRKPGSGAVIIDTRDPATGESALHIVTKRRDATWLSFLLGKGARTDARDLQGNTPLMIATQLSWAEGLSLLIERHAGVDIGNTSGETPLIRAVQMRDITMVRLLLMAGANPAKHDLSAGYSARDYAVRDPRAAAILKAIDEAHPRPKTAVGPN